MRRMVTLLFALLALVSVVNLAQTKPTAPTKAGPPRSIEGVWKIGHAITSGANAGENANPQPSLIIFDKGYYSYQWVRGTAPRVNLKPVPDPTRLTDAEKIAHYEAYEALTTNGGTYEVVGDILFRSPLVAKTPSLMSTDPPIVNEMKWDGDALWLVSRSDAGQPASETRVKLVRMAPAPSAPVVASLNGTWKLNVAKSKYDPNTPPKSSAVTYTITATNVVYTSDGTNAKGQTAHSEYVAKLDGRQYPLRSTLDGAINPNAADTVMLRRVDAHTFEEISFRRGEPMNTSRMVVAADGRTRVTTVTGKNADGAAQNNTLLWERQ